MTWWMVCITVYFACSITVAVMTFYCEWQENNARCREWSWFLFLCVLGLPALLTEIIFNWQPWKTPWR